MARNFLASLLLSLLFPVAAMSSVEGQPVPAILLIDADLAGQSSGNLTVEAASELVSSRYVVTRPLGGRAILPELEPVDDCAPERITALSTEIRSGLEAGRRLFFEGMDGEAAAAMLGPSLDRFFSDSCLLHADPELHDQACRNATLLARIFLLLGRPESASARAALTAERCTRSQMAAQDVPPDARAFLDGVAGQVDARSKLASASLTVVCGDSCGPVYVDGRPVSMDGSRGSLVLAPGSHKVEIAMLDLGQTRILSWHSARFATDGTQTLLALLPGSGLRQLVDGVLVVDGDMRAVAPSLGTILGTSVIGILPHGDGHEVVTLHEHSGAPSGRVLADISPVEDGLRFMAPVGSPLVLVEKKKWPWPWVAGALSTGLLGTGIALNVLANNSADVNVEQSQDFKSGAIAGYVLAGAGLITTVLLAVLRPVPEQSVLVVPSSSGIKLIF